MTTASLSRHDAGEATSHPDLRIVPGVDEAGRYTGTWRVRHVPSGQYIPTRRGGATMPVQWVRRFAHLLAACGVDWSTVEGDLSRVQHPQTVLIRAMENYVLECWHRGAPIGPGFVPSFYAESDGRFRMRCTNPQCEDPYAGWHSRGTAVLADGTEDDDGDEIEIVGEMDELAETAWEYGWAPVDEHGGWLCATCVATHQPAPQHSK